MKKHLFPVALEAVARALGSPDDQYTIWPLTKAYEYDDLWVDCSDLTMCLGTNTVLYTSLKMSEEMVLYVTKIGKALNNITVVGVIEHGALKFSPYVLQGALRFAREEGATIKLVLPKEHEDKISYYRDALEFENHGFDIKIVDAKIMTDDEKKNAYKPPVAVQTANVGDLPEKVLKPSQEPLIFVKKRGGGLFERDVKGYPIGDWETKPPHSEINAHFGNLPLFMNPGDLLMVANLIEHTKPSLIVEMNAYKYGMTALILRLTSPYKTKVVAQNIPYMSKEDGQWRDIAKSLPESDRLEILYSHPEETKETYETDGSVLFIINYHELKQLIGCARLFFNTVKDHGIIAFHAPNHFEAPKFMPDFKKKPGVSEVEMIFNPFGGSWYKDGVFVFDRNTEGDRVQDLKMPEEM